MLKWNAVDIGSCRNGAEAFPSGRPTQFAKTQRAFSTYITLVDTAEWMRWQMRGQLEMYGLSMAGFRLLEMLRREGATLKLSPTIELLQFCKMNKTLRRQCKLRGAGIES